MFCFEYQETGKLIVADEFSVKRDKLNGRCQVTFRASMGETIAVPCACEEAAQALIDVVKGALISGAPGVTIDGHFATVMESSAPARQYGVDNPPPLFRVGPLTKEPVNYLDQAHDSISEVRNGLEESVSASVQAQAASRENELLDRIRQLVENGESNHDIRRELRFLTDRVTTGD